ncbi:MAG: hypothetical protein RLZZ184_71 [Cyanobacteriota bacterium]|jgi:hypothetical protein
MSLQKYLSNLNSADSQWGIWVNPNNINDYRIGQFQFENGGILDGKICIGSLDQLSFGYQSQLDAIKQYLEENQLLTFEGKKVKVNQKEILQAWSDGNLDPNFSSFLEEKSQDIMEMWASYEAEEFVNNKIPEIIEQALEDADQESPYSFV